MDRANWKIPGLKDKSKFCLNALDSTVLSKAVQTGWQTESIVESEMACFAILDFQIHTVVWFPLAQWFCKFLLELILNYSLCRWSKASFCALPTFHISVLNRSDVLIICSSELSIWCNLYLCLHGKSRVDFIKMFLSTGILAGWLTKYTLNHMGSKPKDNEWTDINWFPLGWQRLFSPSLQPSPITAC